jgi:16S rRNA (uracil1498-N3)-methyltransferase
MNARPQARNGARFHCPLPLASGQTIALPERVAHHALRVLRLKIGDALVLFAGTGGEFDATLAHIDKRTVRAEVGAWHDIERESPLVVTLAQGLSSADKMDYTLQKAVELGVTAIQPLTAAKSVARLDSERAARRLEHWRQIAVSACEQCGRNRVPEIAPLADLHSWLATTLTNTRLLLTPRGSQRIAELTVTGSNIVLLAGPEGGFTNTEEDAALAAGFVAMRLGPRILRTETAAATAIAALQARWGDL